jgi:hypothetical protein
MELLNKKIEDECKTCTVYLKKLCFPYEYYYILNYIYKLYYKDTKTVVRMLRLALTQLCPIWERSKK